MSIEVDLYSLLSTNANVLSALGGNNYIWLGAIPKGQPDTPALVLQTVLTDNYYGADGVNTLMTKRVQFDSYAARYSDAVTISNTVRDLLKNITGSLGNTNIQAALLRRDMDMPEEPGNTGYVFRRLIEIEFWHTELTSPGPISPTLPAPPTGANAAFIQGVPVSTTAPTDGQSLVYVAAHADWEPATVSGTGLGSSIDCGTF